MQKKQKAFFIAAFLTVLVSLPFPAQAYNDMWTKAGRGINNVIFGSLEIFHQPGVMHQRGASWPVAIAGGMLKGIGYAVARTAAGVYELVTFPFPGPHQYGPIMEPEHVVPDWSFGHFQRRKTLSGTL